MILPRRDDRYTGGHSWLWRRYRVFVDGGWDNRNRVIVSAWWASDTECGVSVGFGNGNSDPVWVVDVSADPAPRWLRWVADRLDPF